MAEGDAHNTIIIAGQRFALSGKVTVVTFEDIGGFSFPAHQAEAQATVGSNLFQTRALKGKPLKDYDSLVGALDKIILHTDLTQDSAGCFRALLQRGLSTHFMIDWDGTIYQPCDVLYAAYHANEFNSLGIGIDVNNMMPNLVREPGAPPYSDKNARYAEQSKKEYRRPRSGIMKINNGKVQSYGYTDAQYTALIELLKVLTDQLGIPKEVPFDAKGEIVTDVLDDTSFRGIVGHWHLSADRWDPGPGFDWGRVFYAMQGEHNAFPIELDPGVNIATLLEPDKCKEYAEKYFTNNEAKGRGGWYPMGINQTWHGGIHLNMPKKGDEVKAMFDGALVAARFGGSPTKLGNNNFILLRHAPPIPPANQGGQPKQFEFFSLYMHLQPIDFVNVTDSSPQWLKEMMRLDKGKTAEEEGEFAGKAGDEGEEGGDKASPDKGGGDEFDDDGDNMIVEGAIDTKTRWLSLGLGLAALKKGYVAKIEWQDAPVLVRSGDVIGHVGLFGPNQDEWAPTLHVEVFADPSKDWKEAVNLGIHGRYLVELDDDVGTDLFVENPEILNLFASHRRPTASLVPQRVLGQSDIQEFFSIETEFVEEKRFLHKVVTRHISEWSDRVDWVTALSKAEDWEGKIGDFRKILRGAALGKDAITTILPWIWLTKDLAKHIGMGVEGWQGLLDHFHPIQFLIWLTFHSSQRIQSVSRGVSPKKLKQLREKEKAEAEKNRFASRSEYGASFLIEEEPDESAGEVLKTWLNDWDMGEWKRTPTE